jgi:hypothetical protein
MVPLCSAGRTPKLGCKPPELCQPGTIAPCGGSDKLARAATIFIQNGAPQALVGSQLISEHVTGDEVDDGFEVVCFDSPWPCAWRPGRCR